MASLGVESGLLTLSPLLLPLEQASAMIYYLDKVSKLGLYQDLLGRDFINKRP